MRFSRALIPTVKETPADAQVVSHRLMVRAGMIRKVAAGIYTYLPLAQRVLQKVADIVRDEMNRAGAQEILMPAVQPAELWERSGRWAQYGPELLRFHDRKGGAFCLGPTHEEIVTSLVADEVKSYRQLPLNLYQIQTKFRDEVRPRFGLMRGREFIMKDGYSFDVDEAGAVTTYDAMYRAYCRIFARCGLHFRPVEADTGAIGGNRSHEFQVLADTGEDAIVHCEACGYAANIELAAIRQPEAQSLPFSSSTPESVATPGKKTIEDVSAFLGLKSDQVLKAVLFVVDEGLPSEAAVMALCRGDVDVAEAKLRRAMGVETARLVEEKEVQERFGGPAGYVGPVGVKAGVRLVVDGGVIGARGLVAGGMKVDTHLASVDEGRDFKGTPADLRTARAGDPCGRCGAALLGARGIEVGHVFFLGTKYSKPMGATLLHDDGSEHPAVMGCYGIGVSRTAAAAIEQNHDDDGIIWPAPIAPYSVALIRLGNEPETVACADGLYAALTDDGVDVLYDDRDERPGVKFKDHDLIGCPVRIAVGARGLKEGTVELKLRRDGRAPARAVPVDQAAAAARAALHQLLDAAKAAADEAGRAKAG